MRQDFVADANTSFAWDCANADWDAFLTTVGYPHYLFAISGIVRLMLFAFLLPEAMSGNYTFSNIDAWLLRF